MQYELALELKNAGFPQMGDGFMLMLDNPELFEDVKDQTITRLERSKYVMLGKYNRYGEDVYEPTLSELIEACGDRISGMTRDDNGVWAAHERSGELEIGSTPEEAVAHLWLALNKK